MQKELSFRIFVIHHRKLNDAYYQASMLDHFTFVNVRESDVPVDARYKTLKLTEFPTFTPLGKWYTESEVMYNLYQNQELYADVDYVGFIQYDMDASGIDESTIRQLIETEQSDVIFFQPYTFREDYNQRVLMDPNQPNIRAGAVATVMMLSLRTIMRIMAKTTVRRTTPTRLLAYVLLF